MMKDRTPTDSRYTTAFASLDAQKLLYSSVDRGRGTKVSPGLPLWVAADSSDCSCLAGCLQSCRCSSLPNVKSIVHKGTASGAIRTEDAALFAFERLEYCYVDSPIFKVLLQFCKRRPPRQSVSRRLLPRVALAKITKPVTYFKRISELAWVFRDYINTVLKVKEHAMDCIVNVVGLESLAIAPRGQIQDGKGIVTDYDGGPSLLRKKGPRFVYTMPSTTLHWEFSYIWQFSDQAESLLLCLIWIATTRCGPLNTKRWKYRLDSTEIGRWNSRDWDEDLRGKELDRQKRKIFRSKDLFEDKILGDIHPNFDGIRIFLRCLRALIYDPQWGHKLSLINTSISWHDLKVQCLVRVLKSIITDAANGEGCALERALATPEPLLTDRRTAISMSEERTSCEVLDKESLEKVEFFREQILTYGQVTLSYEDIKFLRVM